MGKPMHPRNFYNDRINFHHLATVCPDISKHLKLGVDGSVVINFKDVEALRCLAKALMKRDFDVDIDVLPNTLVPTIPLRLNYILFIEDLLACADIKDTNTDILGLDIGTGASCIYPLMAAKKNKWRMVGSDVSESSVEHASDIINRNNLQDYIQIVRTSGETAMKEVLERDNAQYMFCMCNPPFYGAETEVSSLLKARKMDRKAPNNAFCAQTHEVVTDGGEKAFVMKMIDESHQYQQRIRIFTSMLGIRSSVKPIMDALKADKEIKSVAQAEFFQGHTTRYGVAWTFNENVDLSRFLRFAMFAKKKKPEVKPFGHTWRYNGTIDGAGVALQSLFESLQINYTITKKEDKFRLYNITAYFNTWTHNRLKKREQKRIAKIMEGLTLPETVQISETGVTPMDVSAEEDKLGAPLNTSLENEESMGKGNCVKRKLDESDERDKIEGEDSEKSKKMTVGDDGKDGRTKLVEGTVLLNVGQELTIEMMAGEDRYRRDLHDVMLYVKNHLKLS